MNRYCDVIYTCINILLSVVPVSFCQVSTLECPRELVDISVTDILNCIPKYLIDIIDARRPILLI